MAPLGTDEGLETLLDIENFSEALKETLKICHRALFYNNLAEEVCEEQAYPKRVRRLEGMDLKAFPPQKSSLKQWIWSSRASIC